MTPSGNWIQLSDIDLLNYLDIEQYIQGGKMVSFSTLLTYCLLHGTSAFAFKPTPTREVANRVPVNLSMSGGASSVPDLKVGITYGVLGGAPHH